jgi:hypothetical protein
MKTMRALRTQAPRHLRRPRASSVGIGAGVADATMEPDPGPGPEAVFDRVTGPYGPRRAYDEET